MNGRQGMKYIFTRRVRGIHFLLAVVLALLGTGPIQAAAAPASSDALAGMSEDKCDALFSARASDSALAYTGKPIDLVSGAETLARTDLTVGSIFPIAIERRFHSMSSYDSPLGYGWALSHDRRLYTYAGGSVTLRKDCGGKRRFELSSGVYVSTTAEAGSLVHNSANDTFTYTDGSGNQDIYDARGRLIALVDQSGNSQVITYKDIELHPLTGLLPANLDQWSPVIVAYDYRIDKIEEIDASGTPHASVQFAYNAIGRLSTVWDSTGRSVTYGHDLFGNLNSVVSTDLSLNHTYGYGDLYSRHHLVSITEGQGTYTNAYDAKGWIYQQAHTGQASEGGVIDIEYLIPGQQIKVTTTVKDASGAVLSTNTRITVFDSSKRVASNTDGAGNVTRYVRDPATAKVLREEVLENTGTVDSPNLVLRNATEYTYDERGNVLTKTEAQGTALERTTTYTYHTTYNLVSTETVSSVVDPAQNRLTTNTYDAKGKLTKKEEHGLSGDGAYSYKTVYTYYTNGKIATIKGPMDAAVNEATYPGTSYAYNAAGYVESMTQPLVGTTTYDIFDPLGNPQKVTDPNGKDTIYTYDTTGKVTSVKAPGDTYATEYVYVSGSCGASCSGGSKIDHITLPERNTIHYHYNDGFGNLTSISDDAGNSINYTYDSEGNKLTEEIKAGESLQKSLSYQYDALNRLARIVNPDNSYTEYSYDYRGNKASVRNPNGAATTYLYDALMRLKTVSQPGSINTIYGYNANSNLTTVTDANGTATTYIYDDKGRVYQTISPDTGTTTYAYDPAGNLLTKTDAKGVTISYAYDALNRLTVIDFPADTDSLYTYDTCLNGKGRLCSMTDASGSTAYEYTAKGQVTKETKVIDTITYITQYAYDQNGNMKTMTHPSGKVITYNYTNDRATSVLNGAANLATNIAYKPFGGVSSMTYGNNLSGTISYDNQYRITGITAGAVMNLSYPTYDNNGNIKAIQDQLDPTKNRTFDYDSLDRLQTGTSAGIWGSLSWTYDGVGNRQTENSNSYTYYPNTNRLNGANGITFGYDNNGNTTTQSARVYTYNQNQRLIQVVDGAMTANYAYNGNGQRVKKTVGSETTIFHYSLNGQIIAESNSAGTIAVEYVYLNGQPLAKIEGASTYYYHNDHLGTPQKMTDGSGSVVWAADYKPFGEATITVSTITNNLRFPGQYYDAETGIHYNYYRDYNPALGRYIEADPIGLKGGNNVFPYAGNNSVNSVDPRGLYTIKEPNKSLNTVVCDGHGNMAIQIGGLGNVMGQPKCIPHIKYCTLVHEQSHIDDIKAINPNICKGVGPGMLVAPSSVEEQKITELKGYAAEIDCLQKGGSCGCEQITQEYIDYAWKMLKSYF